MVLEDEIFMHKHVRDMLNSAEKTLSDYSEIIHRESEQNISDDEDAITEASEIVSDNEDAILELTQIVSDLMSEVSDLTSRVEALERRQANG